MRQFYVYILASKSRYWKRVALIESVKPAWDDLADGWFLNE